MTLVEPQTALPVIEDFVAFRAEFPMLAQGPYVNIGGRGMISTTARTAGLHALDGHHHFILAKPEREPLLARTRAGFARLIGADAAEISVTQNVSHGLNWVANGIDWKPGDNVVLGGELEHPNNVFIWLSLARRHGLEVRFAPLTDRGEIDLDGLSRLIDRRTRVVTLSSPTLAPGFRADLAAVSHLAHAAGARFMVDAVQAMGVLQIDVRALGIDALATSTSKGLLGVMGLGFLYVSGDWSRDLSPVFAAITNADQAGSTDDSFNGTDFAFHADGRRFEAGNFNWIGVAVAEASIAQLNALGIGRIETHAVALADRLRDGLTALDYRVLHPADPSMRSHLVTVGDLSPTGKATRLLTEQTARRLSAALDAEDIGHSIRRGVLRVGFHAYNDQGEVDRLIDIARRAG